MKKSGKNQGGNNGRNDKNLSALYGKLSTELPSNKIDEAILSAAHQKSATVKRKKVSTSPFSSNWVVPLSLAATVVLSVSIVLTIPDADFQNPPDSQMRRLATQLPESVEAEKNGRMNQAKQLEPTADRKQAGAQSLEVKEEKRDALSLRKESAKQKPAMAPAERSMPASVAPLRSLEEADSAAPLTNKSGVAPAPAPASTSTSSHETTRTRSVAPKKAAQVEKMKAKAIEKPAASKKTFANISQVKPGLKKQAVLDLLGEPYKKSENSWVYRIAENNQAQNYTITFENNLVISVEMVAPALKQPVLKK